MIARCVVTTGTPVGQYLFLRLWLSLFLSYVGQKLRTVSLSEGSRREQTTAGDYSAPGPVTGASIFYLMDSLPRAYGRVPLLQIKFLCPPQIHLMRSYAPRKWYLEVEPLRGNPGMRAEPSWMGLVPLSKRHPQSSLALLPCEDAEERLHQGDGPHQTPNPLVPGSQPAELWELNVCCL